MTRSPASLLAKEGRIRATALFAIVAAVAFWFVAALLTHLAGERTLRDGLLHPTRADIWVRVLVPTLLVLLYRARIDGRRLHLLSSALETAPDGIQMTSLDGMIAYSNRAVREIYGFSPEELLGKHVDVMNADPTFATRIILPTLRKEFRWEGELVVKHKEGHTFPIWLTTSVVLDAQRRPLGAIGVIRDISDRKRAEQELRDYAHRLEDATGLKDLFADILRHDLLGPAATVLLSLESLLKREPDPEQARRIVEAARRSCKKLIALIEGAAKYANLSTAQQIELETIELGALLKQIAADALQRPQERPARIVFEPAGEYRVLANPMIEDVFENLVSNAFKYGAAGGTIRLDVRDDGDRWRVSVADEGEGIADEDKQKVFDRFERLRKEGVKGTGLGLAIAKRIVDLHSGRIWVEDAVGGGAVFCVSLRKAT